MEDLHTAALACYNNAPLEVKELAQKSFNSTDTNHDGRITIDEFLEFVEQDDKSMDRSLFAALDKNRDGHLDFNEFLTCYYIVRNRRLVCGGCKKKLLELYFTCTICFDNVGDSYNLCVTCYGQKSYQHQHASFLDNHLMLASKKGLVRETVTNHEEFPPAAGIGLTPEEVAPAAGIGLTKEEVPPAAVIRRKSLRVLRLAFDKAIENVSGCGVM